MIEEVAKGGQRFGVRYGEYGKCM